MTFISLSRLLQLHSNCQSDWDPDHNWKMLISQNDDELVQLLDKGTFCFHYGQPIGQIIKYSLD